MHVSRSGPSQARQGASGPGARSAVAVPRASSWVRSVWWDQCLRLLAGGVAVSGQTPTGPAVVVANHCSHADTAVLSAVLGRRAPVLVVAGGDYWRGWRGWLAREAVGILPVARERGYAALQEAAAEHLQAGGVVVIFPEGTRSVDGEVGRFRSGAARLAAATGVGLVPVGLRGTRELFGKGRRLPRLVAPLTVPLTARIGATVTLDPVDDPTEVSEHLRQRVRELSRADWLEDRPSATWEWAQTRLAGSRGVAFTFAWAFAEGLAFPAVAELGVLPVALAHGRRAVPAVAAAVAGSVSGVAANWVLARAGVRVPWPLTTPRMRAAARTALREDVRTALHGQRWNGIPVKVYARSAGELGVPLRRLLPAVAVARGSRIVPIGVVMIGVGALTHRRMRVAYGAALTVSGVGWAVGLERVVRRWKQDR